MARPRQNFNPKTPFSKRLQILFKNEKISRISEIFGSKPTATRSYLLGETEPTVSVISQIVLYTGCDANWLLTGKGEPFSDKTGD
jgi:hypothetical protein